MGDLAAVLLVVILLSNVFGHDWHDDTDEANGKRSGMIVYTDYGTGCQYLGTVLGGITPRLNKDGKTVCVKQGASAAEIEAAFREKAKEAHLDAGGSNEQMAKLNEARAELLRGKP